MTKQKQREDNQYGEGPSPEFSILIGLVSTEDKARILETLASLRNQDGGHTYEVIIADRRDDAESAAVRSQFPEAQMITADASVSLPELRTMALDRSRGDYIVVTEDHCVPAHDWLQNISQAFTTAPDSTVAVGGCVENGVSDSALDWATFLCEYSYFLTPVAEGVTEVLPGMNVAYRRTVFDDLERGLLTEGFWETTLHPLLVASGRTLFSTNKMRIYHCKKFSLRLFLSQRFIYSRYFAGLARTVQIHVLPYRRVRGILGPTRPVDLPHGPPGAR